MENDRFGSRLRELRTGQNRSQAGLSAELEEKYGVRVGQSNLSQLELSDRLPASSLVQALAQLLNTTSDFLLMLTHDPAPRDSWIVVRSPMVQEIAGLIDLLPQEKQAEIFDVVTAMARHTAQREASDNPEEAH